MSIDVVAFYRFFPFADCRQMQPRLLAFLTAHHLRGTILLAEEGINGTVAGAPADIDALLVWLRTREELRTMDVKRSRCDAQPFQRAKVKIKKEIITFHHPLPAHAPTGTQVGAHAWNALLADPDTVVLDARNAYESAIGTFARALTPPIRSFTQLKAYVATELASRKDARIATFCTGGIRCEKLSAWMLEQGFRDIYQLDGGILTYLEEIPAAESRWQGECFVFDERGAVDEALQPAAAGH
jgi:UPF0176 protein